MQTRFTGFATRVTELMPSQWIEASRAQTPRPVVGSSFYAGMRELKTKLIDALPEPGGQLIALYPEKYIFDAPGFPEIIAKDLAIQPIRYTVASNRNRLPDEPLSTSSTAKRNTLCSWLSMMVRAMIFTFSRLKASRTFAKRPGLFSRNTEICLVVSTGYLPRKDVQNEQKRSWEWARHRTRSAKNQL